MLNMLKLTTSPNHSKSLILGSRDSFSYLISTFLKKFIQIAWRYGPETQKYSEMCPVSAPVKIFSIWHYIPIDNHWTDHSYQFWPPNPYTRHAVAQWKTSHMFSIYEKTVNFKTSWKVSFGSYWGPLQIPIDIGPMLSTLYAVNGRFVFQSQNGQLLKRP